MPVEAPPLILNKKYEPSAAQASSFISPAQKEVIDLCGNDFQRFVGWAMAFGSQTPEDAEDDAQDAFERTWRASGKLELRGDTVVPYARTVLKNVVTDKARSRKRQQRSLGSGVSYENGATESAALDLEMGFEDRTVLQTAIGKAIAELPKTYQEVIKHLMQGYSVEETALQMGKTYCSIRLLRHRAMVLLRQNEALRELSESF